MTQLDDVDAFIVKSRLLNDPGELRSLVADIALEMGFDYFALIHHVNLTRMTAQLSHMKDGTLVAMTSYPDTWVEEYIARDFVQNDYILLASQNTNAGFTWREAGSFIKLTRAHRDMYEETRRSGISDGFTVPANIPGEPGGSCSFAMIEGRDMPTRNLPMAQLIGSYAFQAARVMVMNARPQPVQQFPALPLSPRQQECLFFVGMGKTDWEIGKILGISRETVKAHLREARDHYGVINRTQAVLHAIHDGYFSIKEMVMDRKSGQHTSVN